MNRHHNKEQDQGGALFLMIIAGLLFLLARYLITGNIDL